MAAAPAPALRPLRRLLLPTGAVRHGWPRRPTPPGGNDPPAAGPAAAASLAVECARTTSRIREVGRVAGGRQGALPGQGREQRRDRKGNTPG